MKLNHGTIVKNNYDLVEKNFKMDIEYFAMQKAYQTGKKNKNRLRPIVAQFSFYKDKINILKDFKKIEKHKIFLFRRLF